jgi:mRNA interferase HigB
MNVVSRPRLNAFAARHQQARAPLDAWYKFTRKARWRSAADLHRDYPHADLVDRCTVFNIAGNKYRLVTKIRYGKQAVYIRFVLTHPEYDRGRWKDDCGC